MLILILFLFVNITMGLKVMTRNKLEYFTFPGYIYIINFQIYKSMKYIKSNYILELLSYID